MSQIIFEFPLDSVTISDGQLVAELGNGIRLRAYAPDWIKEVKSAVLQVVLEAEGSPPDVVASEPPVE